jgi:hypothetical protein
MYVVRTARNTNHQISEDVSTEILCSRDTAAVGFVVREPEGEINMRAG